MPQGAHVGNAYVTIVPTMEGARNAISSQIGGVGGPAGQQIGEGIGTGISAKAVAIGNIMSQVAMAAAQKAASAIGDVIGGAFENYANYEQLTGGVEKLFSDNAGQVMQYAQQAYQTAGLSANEYMEQVTGFSASLINSLDGDTAEAARIADMAVRDMADNANVFGSNISDIQRAYQGFARGQYGMLDNLKLGYGGTRSEMERLLADAEAISGVHYDIENFSDVAQAINVIQQNMSISGTTATEAAQTIEGSMHALSASWQNWLTAVAGGGDMSAATDALVQSLSNMIKNAVPRLGTILSGLVSAIPGLLRDLLAALPDMATELVTALFGEDAGAALQGVFEQLSPTVDALAGAFGDMAERLAPIAVQMLPALQQLGGAVGGLLLQIAQTLGGLIAAALPYITSFLEWIAPYVQAFIEWLAGAISAITPLFGEQTGALDGVRAIIEVVATAFENAVTFIKGVWGGLVEWFRGLPATIQGFFANIANWFGQKFADVKTQIINKGKEIRDWFAGLPGEIVGFFTNLGSRIGEAFGNIKLPKIGIEGSWNLADWVNPANIPHLTITWAAEGGLVDGATLIGAGEAGREAIVPLQNPRAMQPFAQAVAGQLDDNGAFAEMVTLLRIIAGKDSTIAVDGRELSRAISPYMNAQIGNRAVLAARGNYA